MARGNRGYPDSDSTMGHILFGSHLSYATIGVGAIKQEQLYRSFMQSNLHDVEGLYFRDESNRDVAMDREMQAENPVVDCHQLKSRTADLRHVRNSHSRRKEKIWRSPQGASNIRPLLSHRTDTLVLFAISNS
jgi:hypothetical protein